MTWTTSYAHLCSALAGGVSRVIGTNVLERCPVRKDDHKDDSEGLLGWLPCGQPFVKTQAVEGTQGIEVGDCWPPCTQLTVRRMAFGAALGNGVDSGSVLPRLMVTGAIRDELGGVIRIEAKENDDRWPCSWVCWVERVIGEIQR